MPKSGSVKGGSKGIPGKKAAPAGLAKGAAGVKGKSQGKDASTKSAKVAPFAKKGK